MVGFATPSRKRSGAATLGGRTTMLSTMPEALINLALMVWAVVGLAIGLSLMQHDDGDDEWP